MRVKGVIKGFSKSSGSGAIDFGSYYSIPFHFSDIVNYDEVRISAGLQVEFTIRKVTKRTNSATDVVVSYRKYTNKQLKQLGANFAELQGESEEYETHYQPLKFSPENTFKESEVNKIQQKTIDFKYIALALLGNKIKIVTLTKDGEYSFLDEERKYHNILYPSFIEEAALDLAIEEFEDLINNPKSEEKHFQNFFERNPGFILNDEYKKAHPHIILAKENKHKLIPDFVLEPVNQNEFCDLLELKLPSAQTYVMKKSREHFSADVTEAAAQLRTYGNFFNEEKNRRNFQQKYPYLKIYKPRMFLIIGRQGNENSMIKREIQDVHSQLILKNFDELLARMKWKQQKIKNKNELFK